MNQNYKLTEEQFEKAFKLNGRQFGKTAKYIRKKYGIAYSRQAARRRAQKYDGDLSDRLFALAQYNYQRQRIDRLLHDCRRKNDNTNDNTGY